MGKLIVSMVIFHIYVKLQEGNMTNELYSMVALRVKIPDAPCMQYVL